MIPSGSKDKDKLRSLTKSLGKLSSLVCAASKDDLLKDSLARTTIADSKTLKFFEQQVTLLRDRCTDSGLQAAAQAWEKCQNLKQIVESLPEANPKDESNFRAKAVTVVQELAKLAAEVESGAEQVRACQEDAIILSSAVFTEVPTDNQLCENETGSQTAEQKEETGQQNVEVSSASASGKDGTKGPKGLDFQSAGGSANEFFESCEQYVLVGKAVVSVTARQQVSFFASELSVR